MGGVETEMNEEKERVGRRGGGGNGGGELLREV